MTPNSFRAELAALNLTTKALARLVGVNVRTAQRWVDGQPVPEPERRLLHLAATMPRVRAELERMAGAGKV